MNFIDKHWDSPIFVFLRRNYLSRVLRRIFFEIQMFFYVLQNSLIVLLFRRLKGKTSVPVSQAPLLWRIKGAQFNNADGLKNFLLKENLRFEEGGNTIYLPPQKGLQSLLWEMVRFYPDDAGFKILKDFQSPENSRYVGRGNYVSQGDCYIRRVMTGNIKDQINAANVLALFGFGPSLYDVAEIRTDTAKLTCFVVQHVSGKEPTPDDHAEFIKRLKTFVNDGTVALVPPEQLNFKDFSPPDCNRNLIKQDSTGKLLYVDFQQFVVRNKKRMINEFLSVTKKDFHFGDTRLIRTNKYLYQSIPGSTNIGKRDIDKRWATINKLLKEKEIVVSNRLVLDVGCNAGMILGSALAEGALWGLGWDKPNVVHQAGRLNTLLGNTRVSFFPAVLSESYPLSKDIPERFASLLGESVVFYLAVWKHFGFMRDLVSLPWKVLVFEGHDGDTFTTLKDKLEQMQSKWNCRIIAKSEIRDGDCGIRPLVVFGRL